MTTMRAIVLIIVITVYVAGVAVLWLRRNRRRRPHPAGPEVLDRPVAMPPGHPEHWPQLDGQDAQLAELHDLLWPREEWLFALNCPHPLLTGYRSPAEAHADQPGGVTFDCPCGLVHVNRRPARRRRRRPRQGRARTAP